ncbi:NEL-type E3 ubiquitin ligase domain-containing protein [Pseudomonas putida]|uniref:NEL-type E3 ubiquitin ligase domain-containing protein n=1 Tax=Pseudomonas putida TaxID=303 RepID=UPI002264D681|nr:NEL-type E3 ubiquitin ligase domain-containing protein [Pseudomonas putida]
MTRSVIPADSIDALIARQLPGWLKRASAQELTRLRAAALRQQQAQDQVDAWLGAITPLDEFADSLLKRALEAHSIRQVDLHQAQLRLVTLQPKPSISPALPSTSTRIVSTQTLLSAALHNFHEKEMQPGWFAAGSQLVTASGHLLPLSAQAFVRLCRDLDIGRRYQSHLQAKLEGEGAAVESTLEDAMSANLALAAIAARIKGEIDEQTCQWITQVVGTGSFLPADNTVLKCHSLRLLGKKVIGAVVIEVRQNARLLGVIAWLPEDPYAPVSWHTSWELLYMTLGIRLRNEAYRRYFQRFIAERDRVAFCVALSALLSHGNTVLPLELDGRCFAIEGDVFVALRQARIDKMLDDAQVLAVSTEDEDVADRRARLQGYLDLGLSVAGLAALFVPVLGQALLGLTVVQLAGEVYEGYQDWQLGDRDAALGHLFNVADTVVMAAVTTAGATALGKLAQRVAQVDALVPVSLGDGQLRLCDPSLSGYQREGVDLMVGQAVNETGRSLRRLHDAVYEVSEGDDGAWRIHHPSRPQAYVPALEHNGAGGWVHEFEQPQRWHDAAYMVRRLASRTAQVPDEVVSVALQTTGFDADCLRRLLLENTPPPARLLDAIERQQLHHDFPALRGEAFEEVFNERQISPQAADRVLMRDFPGLSHRCAREIVEGASSVEMESLTGAGRVPLALAERARWAIRDSRIDRACAGLRQAAAENDDTGKLALGLIDAIAPWSAGVNVELPAAGRGGLLQTLRRQLDSRQRQLLGISQMTDDALGERLGREALADREAAARMIGLARVGQGIRPPVRLFDGRLGYPLSGRLTGTRQALRRTLSHVFPVMSSEQLEVYLQDLAQRGVDPWNHVSQLLQAKVSLKQALLAWRNDAELNIVRRLRRIKVARRITASWQRFTPGEVAGDHHLTLRDMQVTSLDAGFLGRFSKVRNLDLRNNRLTRLPAGIEQLTELKNLRLGGNQIVLSSEDNLRLSQLVELRRLELNGNPVGLLPPLASLPLLRRLSLRNTGLGDLPADLARHGNLELLDMRDNQIQTLPEALSLVPLRLLRGLELHDNPLSDETLQRLQLARASAGAAERRRAAHATSIPNAAAPWFSGFTPAQREVRLAIWNRLSQEAGAQDLFRFFSDLRVLREYHAQPRDLQARVWHILEACEQHAEVRASLFEQVARPRSCSDELLLTLSELEIGAMVVRAGTAGTGLQKERALVRLGRSLYRLDKVNAIAARHIADYFSNDPIEVYLTYRVRLADSLDLPAQPSYLSHESFSGVGREDLDAARNEVLREETPQALAQALADRSFWQDYLHEQQAARFSRLDEPFQQRLDALLEQSKTLSDGDYFAQTEHICAAREVAKRQLLLELSREAIQRHGL